MRYLEAIAGEAQGEGDVGGVELLKAGGGSQTQQSAVDNVAS
jgi:hypothetical protein